MVRTKVKPNKLLADSLRAARAVAKDSVIKSQDLSRKDRERLLGASCLTEIIRGWYLLTSPEAGVGGSTAWFGGFWAFVKHYLDDRFGEEEYCLSAESSLSLYSGDTSIPKQIVVITKKASNTNIDLLHDTSILMVTDTKNYPEEIETFNNLNVMSLPLALCRLSPGYYQKYPRNIEMVLRLSQLSVAEISRNLLKMNAVASAERIVGAYRLIGEKTKSEQIYEDMKVAGHTLKEVDPFEEYEPVLKGQRIASPYVGRIRLMWHSMRPTVEQIIPKSSGINEDGKAQTIRLIEETYTQDAYHSLSIEGYQVTEELITKIEKGEWDPENIEADRKQSDALAAKGYYNAFREVVSSVVKVLNGVNSGEVLSNDLQSWYRQLFAPFIKANLLPPEKVAGYRNHPVYITNSRHVPPPRTAVLDCMEVLFELLREEKNAGVRAVLGHFIFVFIHPYMDGNGRMGRFLMNLMLVSGGFNWTVIRTENRTRYMEALELASTKEDITKFAEFVKDEIEYWK